MPVNTLTTLLLGDVYAQPGCRAVFLKLKSLIKDRRADFTIINGENAFGGFGLSVQNMQLLFECGADVITSGNHIWHQDEIYPMLDSQSCLLRPANYSNLVPGHGLAVKNNVAVINLQGRKDMPQTEDPFKWASDLVSKAGTKNIFVDFHAESSEEKEALAFFLDGKITALVGTHVHVQTMDERILPGGTAYITDLGMCGCMDSVIGSSSEVSIRRQLTQLPLKAVPAEGEGVLQGVCVVSDAKTGRALEIERFTV
jgi:hypothetical protein